MATLEIKDLPRGWSNFKASVKRLEANPFNAKVGLLSSKDGGGEKYPSYHRAAGRSVVLMGFTHEYGLGVSSRPFLRTIWDKNEMAYAHGLFKALMSITHKGVKRQGRSNVEKGFREVVKKATEDIRSSIITAHSWAKPLAPMTVRLKGHDMPLIESGLMQASVKFKIWRGKGGSSSKGGKTP